MLVLKVDSGLMGMLISGSRGLKFVRDQILIEILYLLLTKCSHEKQLNYIFMTLVDCFARNDRKSRLMVVSHEAKQHGCMYSGLHNHYSELFTSTGAQNSADVICKSP